MSDKFRELEETEGRLMAIGDIHGCADEVSVLLRFLRENMGLNEDDRVVFIGDYIDRGPNSKGVIDLMIEFQQDFPRSVFLKGNHEEMMLSYIGCGGSMGQVWGINGGAETVISYDIDPKLSTEEVLEQIPKNHLSFLLNLEGYVFDQDYVFVHAGLNPLRALNAQLEKDIFWIRDEFIHNVHYFKRAVVFGHTPYEEVMFHLPYKVGIDTGLVYGNMLSCVNLTDKAIYQVENGETEVIVSEFDDSGELLDEPTPSER